MAERKYHFAKHIREDGSVSAICFSVPRAICLKQATWTNRKEAVTCKKCLKILAWLAKP